MTVHTLRKCLTIFVLASMPLAAQAKKCALSGKTPVAERAKLAAEQGAAFLVHRTTIDNMVGILEGGAIEAGKGKRGQRPKVGTPFATNEFKDQVFLSLWPDHTEINKYRPEPFDLRAWYAFGETPPRNVFLVFDLSRLNKNDYIMNPRYNYGHTDKSTYGPESMCAFIDDIHPAVPGWAFGNEVVFNNPVSLDYLLEVWIDPAEQEVVEKKLKIKFEEKDGELQAELQDTHNKDKKIRIRVKSVLDEIKKK